MSGEQGVQQGINALL